MNYTPLCDYFHYFSILNGTTELMDLSSYDIL